jgi:hypothetical protein
MRSILTTLVTLAALAAAAACSSSSSPAASADTTGGDDGGSDAGSLTVASFQMQATVPAGAEMFKCQYVQLPDVAAFMVAAKHDYTPGSHHMLLFTTDLTAVPPGGDQVTDCYEGTGNNVMSQARGVLYGGQTPTGSEQLPQGVGLPTTASGVLIFQVHYLNASANDMNATVNVDLTLDTNAADITQRAGSIFFYDPFIDVPAGATAKATMRCAVPSDITVLYASSHYHARGVGYGAYVDTAPDQLATTPFYTSNSWSSPDNAQLSLQVKAGSRLRFECDYDNTGGTSEYFAGQSAQTNEMCMLVGTYYPEMGTLSDFCMQDPDMFGTGTAACAATMTCLQACGGTLSLGPGAGLAGGGASQCQQTCMVQSCPTASAPLVAFGDCMRSSCGTACNAASGGPGSSACTSCIAASCLTQYTACQQHACQ